MFTENDLRQIHHKGIDLSKIEKQIEHFKKGFPFIKLVKPAIPGDGLMQFSEESLRSMIKLFETSRPDLKIFKFVPASGAASRMFKHLFEFRDIYTNDSNGLALYNKYQDFNSIYYLIENISKIAFYDDLKDVLKSSDVDLNDLLMTQDYKTILDFILSERGLNYENLPKGLIKFHRYPEGSRTSAHEHIVEAVEYTRDKDGIVRIHFTISPEHKIKFDELFLKVVPLLEEQFRVTIEITFSIQKPSTDIIAVDENNEPFRKEDGSLLFRPGGHGALLENLNEIDADLIFIKNIDNIVPDRLKGTTYEYKKILGGCLISLRSSIFACLERLQSGNFSEVDLSKTAAFAGEQLFCGIPDEFRLWPVQQQSAFLFKLLNRPIRVCGMVRNEGEPGGGPFWVADDNGELSLQIVESAQIDLTNTQQASILKSSTHFNPVDLVCSTRDFRGNPFTLADFVDENTGLISLKSSGGKTLKAQELPGLWNGAMANWITIFVEVPIITFNPVKTVNDLLRKEHLEQ